MILVNSGGLTKVESSDHKDTIPLSPTILIEKPSIFRSTGTYLVVGGGGLGLTFKNRMT